jgi:hypothetical protein
MLTSMLPKMVEHELTTEKGILDMVEHQLRDDMLQPMGPCCRNASMIGQWDRKPASLDMDINTRMTPRSLCL